MSENPKQLHCFYTEDASFFHDSSFYATPSSVKGKINIKALVNTLNLTGVEIDLTPGSVDVQFSGGTGK